MFLLKLSGLTIFAACLNFCCPAAFFQKKEASLKPGFSARYRFDSWEGMNAFNYGNASPFGMGSLNDKIIYQRIMNTGRWTWDALRLTWEKNGHSVDVFGGGTKIHDPLSLYVPFMKTEFFGGGIYSHLKLTGRKLQMLAGLPFSLSFHSN